jgi:hypothetical protein
VEPLTQNMHGVKINGKVGGLNLDTLIPSSSHCTWRTSAPQTGDGDAKKKSSKSGGGGGYVVFLLRRGARVANSPECSRSLSPVTGCV